MPYEKQTWTNGDLMTASKLNHIEEGLEALSNASGSSSGPGCLIVDATISEGDGGGGDTPKPKSTKSSDSSSSATITLNKTAREIIAAFPLVYMRMVVNNGVTVYPLGAVVQHYDDISSITHTYYSDGEGHFIIPFQAMGGDYSFAANSLDDYPTATITIQTQSLIPPDDLGDQPTLN